MTEKLNKDRETGTTRDATNPCLVGRAELARRLGVAKRTVDRMVRRGELPKPCLGAGGRPRWLWDFVIEFLWRRHAWESKLDARVKHKTGGSG